MRPLAFVLNADWRTQRSGAATFTRALLTGLGRRGVAFDVVPMRSERGEGRSAPSRRESRAVAGGGLPAGAGGIAKKRATASWRLACGYLVTLGRDVRHVWRRRRDLRGRVLVVNEFGCETIPIAARVVCPRARIIALAHTHPGCDAAARHPVRSLVERLCNRSVDDVVFNSAALQAVWTRRLELSRTRGSVIHYGIDATDGAVPGDYPAKPGECVDLLCASRFVRWKGHRELLAAFRRAADAWHGLRLVLIGDGPERASIMKQAEALGLVGSSRLPAVVWLGERSDAACYVNGADIGIQLSLEPEAFGLVFLESMARGRPVIGTRMGGIPEVVGDAGLLVPAGDIDAAADAIARLADSMTLRRELGDRGRRRWQRGFTLERMIDAYLAYFDADEPDDNSSRE